MGPGNSIAQDVTLLVKIVMFVHTNYSSEDIDHKEINFPIYAVLSTIEWLIPF